MSWWDDELEQMAQQIRERPGGAREVSEAIVRAASSALTKEGVPVDPAGRLVSASAADLREAIGVELRRLLVPVVH